MNNKKERSFFGGLLLMAFIDIITPKFCLNCGHLGSYICLACEKKLADQGKYVCIHCGKGSNMGITHAACKKYTDIDGFINIFFYNSVLKKILKEIKYRFVKRACKELLYCIKPTHTEVFSFLKKKYGDMVLQPIPLHEGRRRMRGFNQADGIVQYLQGFLPFRKADVLERILEKAPQAQIEKKEERRANIKGVFGLKKKSTVSGRNFMLIDDVVTTGATVKEAAHLLKKNGAKTVYVFSLAKG